MALGFVTGMTHRLKTGATRALDASFEAVTLEIGMPQGVVFDMDGVLVDSAKPHHESWRQLARQHGIEISEERFKRSFGQRSSEIIRTIWGADVTDAQVEEYDAEKEAVYRELIRGRLPLMPGCCELLGTLQQAGCVLAVGTSGPPENLEQVLAEGDLRQYFAVTVNGRDVERGKPAPDCFLLAARRAGLRAEDCVVVEDAPVGVRAGVAAGMQVIGLTSTTTRAKLIDAGAQRVVDELGEISPEMIGELLGG